MNGLMTAGCPASALLNAQSMIGTSDQDLSASNLLEVTFHAKIRIPNGQHLGID